jgi:hypothetical protein
MVPTGVEPSARLHDCFLKGALLHDCSVKYSPKDGHRKYAPSREMDSPYSTRLVLWTVKYTRSTKVDIENSTARQTDDRASVTSKIGGDILR